MFRSLKSSALIMSDDTCVRNRHQEVIKCIRTYYTACRLLVCVFVYLLKDCCQSVRYFYSAWHVHAWSRNIIVWRFHQQCMKKIVRKCKLKKEGKCNKQVSEMKWFLDLRTLSLKKKKCTWAITYSYYVHGLWWKRYKNVSSYVFFFPVTIKARIQKWSV